MDHLAYGYEDVEASDEEVVTKSKELHGTDVNQPLAAWLNKNVELARTRLSACEPLRLANERRKDELIELLGQASFLTATVCQLILKLTPSEPEKRNCSLPL